MTRLTEAQRLNIVHLKLEGYTTASIASKIQCSQRTVKFWVKEHSLRGNCQSIVATGRPRVLGEVARRRAVELFEEGQNGGCRFIARQLYAEGLTDNLVSPVTVLRHAKAQARADGDELICRRGRPPKALSQSARQRRMNFALANKRRCWSHVLFTDRCKFHFRYPGSAVRTTRWMRKSKKGQDGVFTAAHPSVYNVYGGVTRYGTTRLHSVTGTTGFNRQYTNMRGAQAKNITQREYCDVLQETLLMEGARIFSHQGMSCFTLQQDNDPAHARAADRVKAFNDAHPGTVVNLLNDWPGNSPDLSPIENIWAWVDSEVAKMGCATFPEFKAAVDMKFRNVPHAMCANLVKSVPKRLAKCIEMGGGMTGY